MVDDYLPGCNLARLNSKWGALRAHLFSQIFYKVLNKLSSSGERELGLSKVSYSLNLSYLQ